MKPGRIILLVIGAAVVGLVLIGVYINHLENGAEKAFGSYRAACEGKSLPPSQPKESARRLAAFVHQADNSWKPEVVLVPSDSLAEHADEVVTVLCLETEVKTTLDTCAFRKGVGVRVLGVKVAGVSTGDIVRYPRVQHSLPVRVYSTRTGLLIAQGSILGDPPHACDRYTGKPSEGDFDGSGVHAPAIAEWMKKNLPN